MNTTKFFFAVVAGLSLLVATPATAQSQGSSAQDNKGTSTVILHFENMKVSQDVMDTFYATLNDQINQHTDMRVVEGGEVTIKELTLTVGCDKPNPKCLAGMSNYVDADRMVFGSVQRSGDAYLFSIKMFDFAEERFLRKVSEQSVEGDKATVEQAIPAIVEAFLHGETGTLKVSTKGAAEGSRVFFDGEKIGVAPTTMKNLPLGQHAVTVRTSGGEEKTKFVILRHGQEQTVSFELEGPAAVSKKKGTSEGPPILGFAVTGLGVAGAVVGVVGHVQHAKFRDQSEELLCDGGEAVCAPPDSGLDANEVGARASDLQRKSRETAYLRTVGYSVGALGLGIGSYMLYRHYSQSPEGRGGEKSAVRSIRVQPRRGGASLGFSVDFR